MTQFFPEQTIRYKTFAKTTLRDALLKVFAEHPDALLQRTKVTLEYPKTELDYPCIEIRFFERAIRNAGVGHQEIVSILGESDSIAVEVEADSLGSVQLSWPPIADALRYYVYRTSLTDTERFITTSTTFEDLGDPGVIEAVPTLVTATLDTPQPTATFAPELGGLTPGSYTYHVLAVGPAQAVRFQHYFYTADIEFKIGALTSVDRDLVADTLVQTIAFGTLQTYTAPFFDRIYPSSELYPDAQLHFININSDEIQGFGESQEQTAWGAEDDLIYNTSYRSSVFGELYSLPPKLTYGMIRKVFLYPYVTNFATEPNPPGANPSGWVSNSP